MRSLEQEYRNLAKNEPDSKMAQDYLWVAARCEDLSEKNERLAHLHSQTEQLPSTQNPDNLIAVAQVPDPWDGNRPPQIEHIRRVAQNASSPRANWVLLQAAEDVLRLLARNRSLRDALDRYVWANEDRAEWAGWVAAYQSEVDRQAECYCVFVADLPSICKFCQPYCRANPKSLRDIDRPVVRDEYRQAS